MRQITPKGPFFKELAFTATVAALGKSKRLPMIYTLRGEEETLAQASKAHPFYWFLSNTSTFFESYIQYRNRVGDISQGLQKREEPARWKYLGTERQNARGADTYPGHHPRVLFWPRGRHRHDQPYGACSSRRCDKTPQGSEEVKWHDEAIDPADLVHPAAREGRRYVWRKEVLNAEPRSEITISGEEIAHVEAVLDQYVPPEPGRAPARVHRRNRGLAGRCRKCFPSGFG